MPLIVLLLSDYCVTAIVLVLVLFVLFVLVLLLLLLLFYVPILIILVVLVIVDTGVFTVTVAGVLTIGTLSITTGIFYIITGISIGYIFPFLPYVSPTVLPMTVLEISLSKYLKSLLLLLLIVLPVPETTPLFALALVLMLVLMLSFITLPI